MKKLLSIGVAVLMLTVGAVMTCCAESEEKTTLDKVPASVRATIEKQAEGGKAKEIEVGKEGDKSIYEVEIEKGDKTTEYKIDATGQVLSKEDAEEAENDEDAKAEKTEKDSKATLDQAPKEVGATVKKLLEDGKIVEFALEKDGNYELDYRVKGVARSATINPSGKILETEVTVEVSKLPKAVLETLKKLYPKGRIRLAEMSTVDDRSVYELSIDIGITISPDGKVQEEESSAVKDIKVPEIVMQTFKKTFSTGEITKLDVDVENGVSVYDIEFKEEGKEKETDIAADGTMLEFTVVVEAKSLPKAAMQAIRKAAEGATIKRVEDITVLFETKDGKVVKLSNPVTNYAAEMVKGDQTAEAVVTPEGVVVEPAKWSSIKVEKSEGK